MSPDDSEVMDIMPTGNLEKDTRLIESEWVKEAMMQLQELPREERQERNKNFVKSIAEYRGSKEEGFVWMNEKLHGETCKRILADIDWTGGMKNKAENGLPRDTLATGSRMAFQEHDEDKKLGHATHTHIDKHTQGE